MENLLFSFNIFITTIFTIIATGFYLLYKKHTKKKFIHTSLLFLLLVIENSIVYLSEFSRTFETLYETSDLLYVFIYAIMLGIIILSRLITSDIFNDNFSKKEKITCLVYPIIIVVLYNTITFSIFEFIVYASFYLGLIYVILRAYKCRKSFIEKYSSLYYKTLIAFTVSTVILCTFGVVESLLYSLSYAEIVESTSSALSFDYRNIAFDVLKLICCFIGIVYLKFSFDTIFNASPVVEKAPEEKLSDSYIKYSLTNRQQEIVQLIVKGCSNKEISEQLFITEGTVKTHIYNIFKKFEVSSRTQLLNKVMND